MQLNKQLTATLSPSAIGANYTWSAENCTCQTSCINCSCVFFSNISGVVDVTLEVTSTISYPDDCTNILIKLTTTNEVDGEVCEDFTYYEITKDSQGTQPTWSCTTAEDGCQQIASLTPIFETEDDCKNCTTCPCSTTSPCASAQFIASYDCDTKLLTIDTTNAGDWCDGVTVLNYIDINQTLYNAGVISNWALHHVPTPADPICGTNIPCGPAFPVEIDCTDNPPPNGNYSVNVTISLSDCITSIGGVWITCEVGATNGGCCLQADSGDGQFNQQLQPPRAYSLYLDDVATTEITVDFYTYVQADKLSVFTTWNDLTKTGVEVATTDYIGRCDNPCNYFEDPQTNNPVVYYQGYREKIYSALPVVINAPNTPCGPGVGSNTSNPPGSFGGTGTHKYGAARLVLTNDFINTLTIINQTLYIVVYSNQTVGNSDCDTVWTFNANCNSDCPCTSLVAPSMMITDQVCGGVNNTQVTEGTITFSSTWPQSVQMAYKIDGGPWQYNAPAMQYNTLLYDMLPYGEHELCVRWEYGFCTSSETCVNYNKPDCCHHVVDYIVECNTANYLPMSLYDYEITYRVQDCTDYQFSNLSGNTYPANTNVYATTEVSGSDLLIHVYCNLVQFLPTPNPIPTNESYFGYGVVCNDCGDAAPQIQLRPLPNMRNTMNNALDCTPHTTRCCTVIPILGSETAVPNIGVDPGKVNITVNGGTPVLIDFNYAAGTLVNIASVDLGYTIAYINSQLTANGITGQFTFEPLDFKTLAVANIGCNGLENPYNLYTLLHFEYDCGDEIELTIGFIEDYNTSISIDSDTNIVPEIRVHEGITSCAVDAPECGFCVIPLALRTLENIITDSQVSQIEFDDVPGCVGTGTGLSGPSNSIYSVTIIDPSDDSSVPNTVVALEVEDPCGTPPPYTLAPYSAVSNVYSNLQPNYNYYFNPANGTVGLFTIHVEDGRGCTIEYPLCVIDYEIQTCDLALFTCADSTPNGAHYFTGITLNGVDYLGATIPVAAETDYLNVTQPAIIAFLNSIPGIPGGFYVSVLDTEPHWVTISYYGCSSATDFSTHFTHAMSPLVAYQIDDNTPTVAPGYSVAYISDGPFTISSYLWSASFSLAPTNQSYTTYLTADAVGEDLTCTMEIECGQVEIPITL